MESRPVNTVTPAIWIRNEIKEHTIRAREEKSLTSLKVFNIFG